VNPKIFIASSVEGKEVADALQLGLSNDARCTGWHEAFPLSGTTIDILVKNCGENDFAIFVFSPDDLAMIRKTQYEIARDNVLFEAGLFMGMHGRDRTFIVTPQGSPSFHLPSDLLGLTTSTYNPAWAKTNPNPTLEPSVTKVRQATKNSSWWHRRTSAITRSSHSPTAIFPLKLHLTFANNSSSAAALEGKEFISHPGIPLAPNASTGGGRIYGICYFIGRTPDGKDIYQNRCVLDPGASVEAWIPIDPTFGTAAVDAARGSGRTDC